MTSSHPGPDTKARRLAYKRGKIVDTCFDATRDGHVHDVSMRRTQSVRNRTAQKVTPSDDLGTLREAGEQSIEDVLRHELASMRRENEKLQSQIESLNTALRARPPIERVQELEREFSSLELLLHGTQRENERAMAELERAKAREKLLERELKKFAGDNWEESLTLNTTFSNIPTTRLTGTNLPRTMAADNGDLSILSAAAEQPSSAEFSTEARSAHVEQIRTMLLGMTERLQSTEEKLQQTIERAEIETRKLGQLPVGATT